ncbi:MAG: hypothetical protein Q7S95_03365 [bacterium]|nr:hypothetical protein [bacterium]
MPPKDEQGNEELSTLEETRRRLYAIEDVPRAERPPLVSAERSAPHAWLGAEGPVPRAQHLSPRHVRFATYFLIGATTFFVFSAGIAGYFLYYGGNSVSVNNIDLSLEGPSTIAGGDIIPLSIAVTNRNPVAIDNATIEIDFPEGSRSAENVLTPLTVYSENLGTIKSGETVTRAIKAVVFGAAGTTLTLPVSLSYGAEGSNAIFVKKSSYPLAISSTPLSVSVDTVAETVVGKPFTITLQVRSNATVPISNVVIASTFPLGFSLTSSSIPATGSNFLLGTLATGDGRTVTLTGTLSGQTAESRTFHFTVGTAKDANATDLAVSYMSQDATVTLVAPFIRTSLTLNGGSLSSATLAPSEQENVTLSYTNTLSTSVTNATISVTLSGAAVDYSSIKTSNGYYRSSDHTVLFSKDTDIAFASLAPGASGIGSFSFSTVAASAFGRSPSVTFSTSVSGTRIGQANVPEQVSGSATETVKAATAIVLKAASLYSSGAFANSGPIPPKVDTTTSYAISWKVSGAASAVAGAVVGATLPSYVTYTGATSGQGSVSFDPSSRMVTWSVGDLSQGGSSQASFQVALLPSSSQKGYAPKLTSTVSFSGYDRFAGVTITSSADPVTTETFGDPGYSPSKAIVQ